MKEEYLEIEEYDDINSQQWNEPEVLEEVEDLIETKNEQTCLHCSPVQKLSGNEQEQNNVYQTHPQDFDGNNDDQMLRKLLKKFQMSFLYPFFKAYDVTYRSLRFLSTDDINTTIRSIGHRAEFREKLFAWRRKRYRTNDVIIEHEKPAFIGVAALPTDMIPTSPVPTKIHCTKRPINDMSSTTNQLKSPKTSKTKAYQNLWQSLKLESDAMDNANSDNEGNENDAKRIKNDSVVELRENHITSQLHLDKLLNESLFGPVMNAFYKKHGYLERKHRDELIHLIVSFVIANEIKLHSSDFAKIVDKIVKLFPSEEDSRDYYYINRQGKRNPMGRLYTKYYNTLKRMRVRDIYQEFTQDSMPYLQSATLADDSMLMAGTTAKTISTPASQTRYRSGGSNGTNVNEANNNACSDSQVVAMGSDNDGSGYSGGNNTQIELIEDEFQELIQLDDTSASAIKNFLRCQGLDWDDIKTMWSKTYVSRQEDVEHSTIKDVLQLWPKYLSARGIELFDIDFRLKFSRIKANVLQRKWPHFARKMSIYYQTNIKDEMCKGLYALWKTKPGKDTEDYILTVLLNAIMLPSARYRDAVGNRRKVAIVEAVDLFAIRVTNLEELDHKREEFNIKYSEIQSDLMPLIVVVGDNSINIHEVYIHFDMALYNMPDYLSALDACIKIHRVLNLPYPASNEYVWTFLQRYFYEILLPSDMKSPSMSSIMSYLKC